MASPHSNCSIEKGCPRCGKTLSLSEFAHRSGKRRHSYESWCTPCRSRSNRERQNALSPALKLLRAAYMAAWRRARTPEQRRQKNAAELKRRRRKRAGETTEEKERRREQYRLADRKRSERQTPKEYKKYRDRHRQYELTYSRTHREDVYARQAARRVLVRGSLTVETITLSEIAKRDSFRCQICRRTLKMDATGRFKPTLDHIVPVSLGGAHNYENLQLAHLSCNAKRGQGRIPAQLRIA